MQITYFKFLIILILSALLLGVSFPFTGGVYPLAFIALVPLFIFNVEINQVKKWRGVKRFLGNYLYFLLYNVFTTWWIYNASAEGAYMAFFANSFLMTLPFFFFGFTYRQLGLFKSIIAIVVYWISFEHIHHYWDLSWPWLSFGNIFANHPLLIQWYEYSGVEGGSLWILIVNAVAFYIVYNVWIKKEKWSFQAPLYLLLTVCILFPLVSSYWIYSSYQEKVDPVEVVVIQPNLDPYTKKFSMPVTKQLDIMLNLADAYVTDSTDLVVCPETALASYAEEHSLEYLGHILKIRRFSDAHNNVPILIGADTYGAFEEERPFPAQFNGKAWIEKYNTALLIDGINPLQIYHKSKLVLGAEKVPFVDIFPFMAQLSISLEGTNSVLVSEPKPKNFTAKGLNFAPLICYESVYGEFDREFSLQNADFLCVMTNDGWWGKTPGYKQHQALSQIRAIENRRYVVRSANTGISCVINQKGEVVQSLDWDVEGAIKQTINASQKQTFFMIYGDFIGRLSEFLSIGLLLYAIVTFFRSRGTVPTNKYR